MQILNIDPYNTNKILPHRIEKILYITKYAFSMK